MSLTECSDNTQATYAHTPLILQGWLAYLHADKGNLIQALSQSYLLELASGFRV